MRSSTPTAAAPPSSGHLRRWVLCGAIILGLAIAMAPRAPGVHAQDARPSSPPAAPAKPDSPSVNATVKDGNGGTATLDIQVDKGKKSITIEKSVTSKPGVGVTIDDDDEPSGPVIGAGSGKHGKGVRVGVFGDDRQYDSFNDFVHSEPGLAFMVVSIVALVFLSPVLAIGLILWYRMRKARMLNETMLRLAEKGVVPPAEAINALAGGAAPALTAVPSAAPLYEQAKQIQRRAAWSDLRKGVILGGFGLGLTVYSMLDDGTPNALGLVLLFVGIGYIVLWWFEDRQVALRGTGAGAAPPPPPSGGTGGVA
jgi:uncharacterized protein DUF6249